MRDQFHDPSFTMLFHLLDKQPEVTAFVKHAELAEDVNQLPDSAFAWPEKRFFPIHTAEHTVLSSMYRRKYAEDVPAFVDTSLDKAQDIYGVKPLLVTTQEREKTAQVQPTMTYLLPRLKRLNVKTAADVPVAEKLLLEQYPKLSLEDRAEGFINLVKVARDMGVPLSNATHQMAGMTVCTTKTAADFIEARRCATKVPLFQQAYEKLAAAVRTRGQLLTDRDELVKVADAIARLDQMADLQHLYDKKLPDPIKTVFNTTKLASDFIDLDGRQVSIQTLATLPTTFWEDVLGPEMVKEVTNTAGDIDTEKLRQIIPTLPLDLKIILKHQVP